MSTKDFKDAIKCSFTEGRKGKFFKYIRTIDPLMRSFDAEVITYIPANS